MVPSDTWVRNCGLYVFLSMVTNIESVFLLSSFMPNSLLESPVLLSEFGFQTHGELDLRQRAFSVGSYAQLCL